MSVPGPPDSVGTMTPSGRDGYLASSTTTQRWRQAPVQQITTKDGHPAWIVTDMDLVQAMLSDPRFSRAEARRLGIKNSQAALFARPGILDLDPPEHSRLRRLVAGAFTARRVRALRPRIQQITDDLLAEVAAAGPPCDLNAELCFPLPIAVICEILGVPYADREHFREWSARVMALTAYTPEEQQAALDALTNYIAGLVAAKRNEPDDSLLQSLITARDNNDRLDEDELVNLGLGLLVAGHETTANMLGKGLVALLDHPEQVAKLRAEPDRVPGAVEEVLRYVPLGMDPDTGLLRVTTCEVELGGVRIPAGHRVLANTMAANRDPDAFDTPEEFDLARPEAGTHVTFGHGAHHCLGAQLARMELEIAFSSLLTTFPELRPAVPIEDLTYRGGMLIPGLDALPVTW